MRLSTPFIFIVLFLLTPAIAHAEKPPVLKIEGRAERELHKQMLTGKTMPVEYWYAVAQCETQTDWKNTGRFAGGLGIYTNNRFPSSDMGTWERWGGEEFAKSPDKATMTQQIVIANRIAVFGWSKFVVRADGGKRHGVPPTYTWSKNGVGYNGWGCIKHNKYLDPKRWKR
jgi:hypothetical protein